MMNVKEIFTTIDIMKHIRDSKTTPKRKAFKK